MRAASGERAVRWTLPEKRLRRPTRRCRRIGRRPVRHLWPSVKSTEPPIFAWRAVQRAQRGWIAWTVEGQFPGSASAQAITKAGEVKLAMRVIYEWHPGPRKERQQQATLCPKIGRPLPAGRSICRIDGPNPATMGLRWTRTSAYRSPTAPPPDHSNVARAWRPLSRRFWSPTTRWGLPAAPLPTLGPGHLLPVPERVQAGGSDPSLTARRTPRNRGNFTF